MANFKDIDINVINFSASEERPVIFYTLSAEKELFEAKEVKTIIHAYIHDNETKIDCFFSVDGQRRQANVIKFYMSEQDFRSNIVFDGKKLSLYNYSGRGFNRCNCRYYQGSFSLDYYAFINGKAKLIDVKSYYTDGKNTWDDWSEPENVLTNENTYSCIEDVYKSNPYTIIHADGSEEVRQPIMNRIKLLPEQIAALDKVKAAMMEAKELGVKFYYDTEDYDMYAFNGKEVSELTWDSVDDNDKPFTLNLSDIDKVHYNGFPRVTDINCDCRIILNH